MRLRVFACVLAVACLAGCNGPKDSCQGSFESYYSLLKGHDWDGVFELLTPEFKRKVGTPERLTGAMEDQWAGSKSFSVKVDNVVETAAGVCIANGSLSYTVKVRGENPYDVDNEYFSWTFKKGRDGKWYIDLPGSEKIQSF